MSDSIPPAPDSTEIDTVNTTSPFRFREDGASGS